MRKFSKPRFAFLFLFLLQIACLDVLQAQDVERVGVPWNGGRGVQESVTDIMGRQSREGSKPVQQPSRGRVPNNARQNPDSPKVSQWPPAPKAGDKENIEVFPAALDTPVAFDSQTIGTSFTAGTYSVSGYVPPSPMGAVGPSQILMVINGTVKTFNRSGAWDGALDVTTDVFFGSVRGTGFTTDPRVVFDRSSQRWFVSMINAPAAPNRIMIAVSNGPAITSQSSFTFYQFVQDAVGGGTADNSYFADFPSLGVDNYALYIGVNIFDTATTPSWTYKGATGFVVNKANLLAGNLTVTAFRQIGFDQLNMVSPQGVTVMDSSVTSGFFIGTDYSSLGTLRMRRISDPGGTPGLSGTISLFPPATFKPVPVPAQGSNQPLDAVDDRLMNVQIVN